MWLSKNYLWHARFKSKYFQLIRTTQRRKTQIFTGRAQSSRATGSDEPGRAGSEWACAEEPRGLRDQRFSGMRLEPLEPRTVSGRALSLGSVQPHLRTWKPGITGFKIWSFSLSNLFRPVPDLNLNPESLLDDSYLNDIQQILSWGLDRFHPSPWQVVGSDVLWSGNV